MMAKQTEIKRVLIQNCSLYPFPSIVNNCDSVIAIPFKWNAFKPSLFPPRLFTTEGAIDSDAKFFQNKSKLIQEKGNSEEIEQILTRERIPSAQGSSWFSVTESVRGAFVDFGLVAQGFTDYLLYGYEDFLLFKGSKLLLQSISHESSVVLFDPSGETIIETTKWLEGNGTLGEIIELPAPFWGDGS